MTDIFIDYSLLVDEAMHIIIKKSLQIVAEKSFIGDHHFFISFNTMHKGVKLSKTLRKKYPEEMTIVLQHQFENLIVTDEYFEVTLRFDNTPEQIVIPFKSLTAFADPSVKFGLQFKHYDSQNEENEMDSEVEDNSYNSNLGDHNIRPSDNSEKVISLDSFRKKNK
jgi:uncharacterized protein